jgi:hypothetical protein
LIKPEPPWTSRIRSGGIDRNNFKVLGDPKPQKQVVRPHRWVLATRHHVDAKCARDKVGSRQQCRCHYYEVIQFDVYHQL